MKLRLPGLGDAAPMIGLEMLQCNSGWIVFARRYICQNLTRGYARAPSPLRDKQRVQPRPIEKRPWICLASGRDIRVPDHRLDRIALLHLPDQPPQPPECPG